VNLDVSVAPEIAQLIEPRPDAGRAAPGPAPGPGPAAPGRAGPAPAPTAGRLAGQLRLLTAEPGRWWGLVRFDPGQPVRVPIPAEPWYDAWLVVIPPPRRGGWAGDGGACACDVVTVVAGEVTEQAARTPAAVGTPGTPGTPGPLLSGRFRVHAPGPPHRLVNLGGSYAVTLHARARG
jgi:hypothetical protein